MGIIKIRDGDTWKNIPALTGPRGMQGETGKTGPYYEPELQQNGDLYFHLKGQEENDVQISMYMGNIQGHTGISPHVSLYTSKSPDGLPTVNMNVRNNGEAVNTYQLLTFDRTMSDRYSAVDAEYLGLKFEDVYANLPRVFIDGIIPTTQDEVFAELRYEAFGESFHAYIKIKCQGTSSMSFPKKNFTIKLYQDAARRIEMQKTFRLFGQGSNKFVLKANWVDHSHARNIIGARLWSEIVASRPDYSSLPAELRNSPNNGAVNGFPIKVYTNGEYQGVYTWNIGKDEWMFGMDKGNPNHVVLAGETNTNWNYAETPCNFRALWSGVDEEHWSVEVGKNSEAIKSSLNALISFVMTATDDQFKQELNNYLDVQGAIDYYVLMYVCGGFDNLAKNMLLITYDLKKWHCGAYDMDIFFGCNGLANTFLGATKPCPEEYAEAYSLLWERIEKLYVEELKARYPVIREKVLNFANIVNKFERFVGSIGKDLLEEDLEVYPAIPLGNENHIKQMRNFVRDRLAYVDDEIKVLGTGFPAGVDYMLTQDTSFDGVGDYVDTGVCLFDTYKDFTIFLSFTGDEWKQSSTVFSAALNAWGAGVNMYSYVSSSDAFYTFGSGAGSSAWLGLTANDAANTRYNVVLRLDSANNKMYWAVSKNGIAGNSGEYDVTYSPHYRTTLLGADNHLVDGVEGVRHFWKGTIHKAGVWQKLLTNADVQTLLAL